VHHVGLENYFKNVDFWLFKTKKAKSPNVSYVGFFLFFV